MKKKFLCFGNNVNRQTKQLIFSRLIQNLQNFFLEKKTKLMANQKLMRTVGFLGLLLSLISHDSL